MFRTGLPSYFHSAAMRQTDSGKKLISDMHFPTTTFPSNSAKKAVETKPAIGIILVGGTLVGAQVKDIRLANELVRRGYDVNVWWAFDRPNQSPLDPRITERWLFSWSRYAGVGFHDGEDLLGKFAYHAVPARWRSWISQNVPGFIDRQLKCLLAIVCADSISDRRLARRFGREMRQVGITHLLPTLELLAILADAACQSERIQPNYTITFQGYEVYARYACQMGIEKQLYSALARCVSKSPFPAMVMSQEYANRISREVGLNSDQMRIVAPGVPTGEQMDLESARRSVKQLFPGYRADVPLVTYLGRRDAEKGIDLLLYAIKILAERGVPVQLALCGPTAFGTTYIRACEQIAGHLRLPVFDAGYVSDEQRSALFRSSHSVVYPAIHEEPFGMVPVEAMAQGTPVIVPDHGGISGVVEVDGIRGGTRFRCWDSGSLANELLEQIGNPAYHAQLASGAIEVANYYSIEKMGARVLAHLELPEFSSSLSTPSIKSTDFAQSNSRAA